MGYYMAYDFTKFKNEAKRVEDWLSSEYLTLHTGRATPAVLDKVMVDSYGSRQSISHVANIVVEDARTLMISPWDKAMVQEIEKAIMVSELGLSTSVSDSGIRVSFPELTVERKQSLIKVIKDKLEDARISVRKEREEVWEDIQEKQKASELTEDDKFRLKDDLQKLVDEANKALEDMADRKEKDIMG